MATKFPEGSMGAAEQKGENRFKLIGSVAIVVVALCQMVFNTNLQDAFALIPGIWKVLSGILYVASIVALWRFDSITKNPSSSTNVFVSAGLLLAALIAGGLFNTHG